eukprot:351473_1
MLSNTQKEKLIFGYIRFNCNAQYLIPIEMIRLCNCYFKSYITWNIPKSKFNQNNSLKQEIDALKCNIKDIQFECKIFGANNTINFKIYILDQLLPTEIKQSFFQIRFYYEIAVNSTNTIRKCSAMFDGNEVAESVTWNYREFDDKIHSKYDNISFDIYINISEIVWKDNTDKQLKEKYNFGSIHMCKEINYDWIIDRNLLNKFKQCHFKYKKAFCSPNFGLHGTEIEGDNFAFCLYFLPADENINDGHRAYNSNNDDRKVRKSILGLLLLNHPAHIAHIEFDIILKSDYKNIIYNNSNKSIQLGISRYRNNWIRWDKQIGFEYKELMELRGLTLSVAIVIKKVFAWKGVGTDYLKFEEVDAQNWYKYGIK